MTDLPDEIWLFESGRWEVHVDWAEKPEPDCPNTRYIKASLVDEVVAEVDKHTWCRFCLAYVKHSNDKIPHKDDCIIQRLKGEPHA